MLEKIKSFFFGSLVQETLDVGITTATLVDESDREYRISRKGFVEHNDLAGILYFSGKELLIQYLIKTKYNILTDDVGNMFPVARIKAIRLNHIPKEQVISYRK